MEIYKGVSRCSFTRDLVRELDDEELSEQRLDELDKHLKTTCRACHDALTNHGQNMMTDEDIFRHKLELLKNEGDEALLQYIITAHADSDFPLEQALKETAFIKRVNQGDLSKEDQKHVDSIIGAEFSEEEWESIAEAGEVAKRIL